MKVTIMKMKRKLELNRQKALLLDLEKMHEKGEISEQTYEEMKKKYEEKLKDIEEHLEDEEEELELELEDLGEDMSELGLRISEKVNSAVARAMDKVHTTISTLPSSFENFETGESYTEEEVFEGSFDADKVCIDFDTVNGHIELEKWDQDTYKIVATKKVRSYSEERAREKLEKIKINFEHEKKDGKDVLRLSPSESGASVSITAYLPGAAKGGMLSKDHPVVYDIDVNSVNGHLAVKGIHTGETELKTVNGRIEIEHVHADDLDAESENGRITLEDTEAEKGSVSTENGRLELDNVRGKTITGSTENGSIRGRMSFEDAELKTENGSIRLYPRGKGKYDLQTEMGSISIDVERSMPHHIVARTGMGKVRVASDLEIASKNRHCITVESPTYESAEERLSVDARTDMGSVKIR
jgi:DUF4097 and DUF4098 domain-containing protein YvlB